MAIVFILIALITIRLYRSSKQYLSGHIFLFLFFTAISFLFYILCFSFPGNAQVGPDVIPKLWISILFPLSLIVLYQILKEKPENLIIKSGRLDMIYLFIVFLIGYLFAIFYVGYYISTFVFLIIGMNILGNKNHKTQLIVSVVWNLFSYLIFYKLLYIPLPLGRLIEILL